MHAWKIAGVIALAVIVLSIPYYVVREMNREASMPAHRVADAEFVGRDQCTDCHEAAYEAWLDSDHDKAMAHADEESVLGDFNDAEFEQHGITSRFYGRDGKYFVHTEGPGGEMGDFEIAYTFGVEPLQQYLVPFPGGRLQSLTIAWDTELGEWFALYPERIEPDDWLHWTRNAQNWNGMCAECHSTNLRKNYDADSKTFDTTWSEVDVSCEACHGPGSRHVEWAEIEPMGRPETENYGLVVQSSGIDNRQQVEMCAPCHSRRGETGDYDHRQTDLLEQLQPSLLQEGLYHADGQILDEVYVWGSFVQSKMYANGVRCSDCHDVHSLKLHKEGNELCLQCHRADTYDAYEHHFHQKVHEGEPSDGALCVKCHMPEQTYMVVDERADHSLRVPRPDLTLELGVPNACSQSGCHDSEEEDVQWAADAYTEWYGKARKPHYGTIVAAAWAGDPEALEGLVTLIESPLYPAIVRATALNLLQGYPGTEATRLIRRALEDEEALMRHTAVSSFTPESPEELLELLAPLLFDPVRVVRMQAASRLAGIERNRFKPYQLEAFDEALEEYIASSRANLDFAASGMNLGNLYAALGNAESAETYYRAALEVDDLFYPAKMNLAVLLSQRGENVETERLLREVLSAYPDQHEAAYSLALLLVGLNRADEALDWLGRAANGLPGRSRVHYNHGLLLAQTGDDAAAEAALEQALDLEPENIDYMYALVDFFYRRGRLIEAMALVERMIRTHPENRLGYDLKQAIGGQ
ncbi:MAG: tetratricopeptide repeat protein [Gemmatimonadetes bacterium]|nr:tetratricopeptide repeat protein [Xanthomonadales bacterium]NIS01159.1 tetratricopeptide repeat protein [Gemmatimonadota bacterium]NIX14128.1 tetratricopeptide repeat protein [Xanthomonadales bacterium]